ncbi:MAG: hypothetical protein R6U98_06640 [Pirellulaceae bacterium]
MEPDTGRRMVMIRNRVLIRPDSWADEPEGGLIKTARLKGTRQSSVLATVLAVGPEVKEVQEGDRVILDTKYANGEVLVKQVAEHIVIDDSEIAAVVTA